MSEQHKDNKTLTVPFKLIKEAHAVMRACGWKLAPAAATSDDGVLEAAAAEIEEAFAELIGGDDGSR